MPEPLVSIVIPIYNRADLIKETLESVLCQTYKNWECLVVDDGSTDNTWAILERYAIRDARIKFFKRNKSLKGANVCRNIGIQHAKGVFVMFLDSDDILAPWCVESRVGYSTGKQFDLMIFQAFEFDNLNLDIRRVRTIFGIEDPFDCFMNCEIPWGTPEVLWNTNFLQKIGGWYESAQSWQDIIINMIALTYNPVLLWGNPVPDVFICVTTGFDKISNTYNIERIVNRCESLQYLKNRIQNEKFDHFERKYLIDIINRIEFLSNEQINCAIDLNFNFMMTIRKIRFLKLYFKLYVLTRNVKGLRSLIYHSRGILGMSRKKIMIERPEISEECFNDLLMQCRKYPYLKNIMRFIGN